MKSRLVHLFVALSSLIALPAYAEESTEEDAELTEDAQDLEAQPGRRFCFQPIVTGPCRAAMPRYAFNAAVGRCVPFIYGGCQGNRNNFTTLHACQRACYRLGPFRMP